MLRGGQTQIQNYWRKKSKYNYKKTNPTYEIQTSVGLWEEKGPVMAGACGQWANGVGQERQGMARESDCQVVTTQCRRFFSWYKSLHNSMWRRIHKVHFYNTSSFKTLHGFSSKAGWKWTLWQNCICKRPNKAGEAICILCIEVSKLSQARHKQQLPCNACGQRMGTVKLISTVTQFRGAQSIVCFGIQRRQSGVWQAKP